MGKMAAMVEVHTHKGVARLETCHENCHIGLCAGMRLHIGIFRPEKLLQTILSKGLRFVNHLATAIIAVAGITFGVLVGQA